MGKKFESLVECHYSNKLNKEGRMQPMTRAKAKAIDTIYDLLRMKGNDEEWDNDPYVSVDVPKVIEESGETAQEFYIDDDGELVILNEDEETLTDCLTDGEWDMLRGAVEEWFENEYE